MITKITKRMLGIVSMLLVAGTLILFVPRCAAADDNDPPTRVARLAYFQGSVSFEPAGVDDWVDATINRPVTIGDKLWSDSDGRLELQLDGSLIRLSNNTGISFLNLNDNITQIQLSSGTLLLRVRRLDDAESYEVDTPNLAFSILRPGLYRISVDESGVNTAIKVRSGEGEVTGGGAAYTVRANEFDTFSGTEGLAIDSQEYNGRDEDQFDLWASNRDAHWSHSNSARYVSADVVGYEDLDDHGDWRANQVYGNVWFPRTQQSDWAPYHYGHWAYIEPWGYSWVDDEPWGFAPFHYGRWVSVEGRWGWIPAPPRAEGGAYVRPVYAPALVAWVSVGGGGGVAWFALGPREVYVPSYPVSEQYVNNINISNTNVTTTVVTNTYNTTIVNKNVNVTNVTYVNQHVQGAVAATTVQAFTSAQPVSKNVARVDARAVASAPVRVVTPAEVPNKQAVLGVGSATGAKQPPATIQTRAVVAKQAPPPPPPTFERQQAAIKSNGGQPLTVSQIRQIQPAATAARPAPVKIAPAPARAAVPAANAPAANRAPNAPAGNRPADRPGTAQPNQPAAAQPNRTSPAESNRPAPPPAKQSGQPENRPQTPNNPAEVNPNRPENRPATPNNPQPQANANRNAAPTHPNELPPVPKTPPPASNPQLEQKHQQEQEQLRAQQEQERQKLQQQQEGEHAKLAQQQADAATKQKVEQQHQQQTQQLQQKHVQEQEQLKQKQQQEKEQQEKTQEKKKPSTEHDRPLE